MAPDSGKLADACPEATLGAGNLEQAHYRDAHHGREGYAPPHCVRPVRIVVVVVLVWVVVMVVRWGEGVLEKLVRIHNL